MKIIGKILFFASMSVFFVLMLGITAMVATMVVRAIMEMIA